PQSSPLSLPDALPIFPRLLESRRERHAEARRVRRGDQLLGVRAWLAFEAGGEGVGPGERAARRLEGPLPVLELSLPNRGSTTGRDRKSTRLNSSHLVI